MTNYDDIVLLPIFNEAKGVWLCAYACVIPAKGYGIVTHVIPLMFTFFFLTAICMAHWITIQTNGVGKV